jgi:hypothetical protein
MGQESERWNVRCAQKMTKRGGAGKGSGSKGCRGAEHGQACNKERTGAVALRAALESAEQLGESTKATGKPKWPTIRNVRIRYRLKAVEKRHNTIHAYTLWNRPKPKRANLCWSCYYTRPVVCTLGALTANAMSRAHARQQEPSRRTKCISGR